MSNPSPPISRAGGLVVTGEGTNREAYALIDWAMFGSISLIWGASFLFIAIGLRSLEPGVIAAARVMLGAGALLLFPAARRRIERSDRLRVVAIGLVSQAAPALLFALAEERIESALAGMLVSATPILTALLMTAITRRLPGRVQLVGLSIGFLGVIALTAPSLTDAGGSALGVFYVALAISGYAFANVLYPPLQQTYGALPVIMWALVAASIVLLPLGVLGLADSSWEWGPVLAILALGVVGTGLARAMHMTLIGRVGPNRGAVAGYSIPVIALILGVVFLDETVALIQIGGVALALAGSYLVSRKDATTDR
ncbi:MAG: EamA family transporter [Acidimicrobiia bacterium]|nr:DMT family transporter [Acidimicrobiia bacterium]MBT8215469.1 DMT family transporter [Acidimicrobiia bacterium]NNF11267.1 EamA family transporter [Acidimicrobiia bacterium]NNL69002.1 EamA family transporter [Acidimicrobiia bacterium]